MPLLRVAVGVVLAALTAAIALLLLTAPVNRLQTDSSADGMLAEFYNENALPGEITDFSAVVTNPSNADAVLVSATLIPVRGFPVPQLHHLGLVPFAKSPLLAPVFSSALGSDYGWPPRGIKVRPFTGASISSHGQAAVAFGISGHRFGGDYAVAGLRIRYRLHGHLYDLNAWSAALDCISSGDGLILGQLTDQQFAACNAALVKVDGETAKMAGYASPDCATMPAVLGPCTNSQTDSPQAGSS